MSVERTTMNAAIDYAKKLEHELEYLKAKHGELRREVSSLQMQLERVRYHAGDVRERDGSEDKCSMPLDCARGMPAEAMCDNRTTPPDADGPICENSSY